MAKQHQLMKFLLDTHYLRDRASGDVKSCYINFEGKEFDRELLNTLEAIAARAASAAEYLRNSMEE